MINPIIQNWQSLLGSSFFIAVCLFILNWGKDFLTEKNKDRVLRKKVKFENTYDKSVEIIEKLNKDLNYIFHMFLAIHFTKIFDSDQISDLIGKIGFTFGELSFAKLYLTPKLINKADDILHQLSVLMDDNYISKEYIISESEEKDVWLEDTRSRFTSLLNEFNELSKQIIHEKV